MRTFLASVLTSIAVLAAATPASATCANENAIPTADNLELIREAVICLHNEARRGWDSAQLERDGRLASAAQAHADDMVADQYFAHDAPSGLDPFDRMRETGYIGRGIVWNAGETIAWASGAAATPKSIVDSWMDATTQRLTIVAPDFRDIGVGVALGAPVERAPDALPAVTYAVDYGWRTTERALRTCLRRAAKRRRAPIRRAMRARCHGLEGRAARVG